MKRRLIFLSILVLGGVLRFYSLAKVPVSLYSDEAAIGYNAYSILMTGRDEFGDKFPINFRSFNDYKPPLAIYLTVISEKFLGLTDLAVRLPAALSGLTAIALMYLLVKKLNFSDRIALISALLLAVNPWHMIFSRALFEVQIALTLTMAGVVCFLSGNKKPMYYMWAAIFWSFSLYTYHAARLFVPLLGIFLLWVDNFNVVKYKRWLIASLLLGLILNMPLLLGLGNKEMMVRPLGISIFNNLPGDNPYQKESNYYLADGGGIISRLIHNRRWASFRLVLDGYLKHFAPRWLFYQHDNAQFGVAGASLFYYWEIISIPIGFVVLAEKKSKHFKFLLFWLLLAPLAAAFAFLTPSVVRSLFMVVPLVIFSAAGVNELWEAAVRKNKIMIVILLLLPSFMAVSFVHNYFKHYPGESGAYWDLSYKELFDYVGQVEGNYRKVIFFPEVGSDFSIPHVFLLYYLKYLPKEYLAEGGSRVCDFGHTGSYSFGKYEFRSSGCRDDNFFVNKESFPQDSLIVDRGNSGLRAQAKPIRVIQDKEGRPLLTIYDSNRFKTD